MNKVSAAVLLTSTAFMAACSPDQGQSLTVISPDVENQVAAHLETIGRDMEDLSRDYTIPLTKDGYPGSATFSYLSSNRHCGIFNVRVLYPGAEGMANKEETLICYVPEPRLAR